MLDLQPDLNVINQIKAGERNAFGILVVRYQYKIFKAINKYLHEPSDAMDATQETFIKAFGAIDRFQGLSAFYTWLYSIAINTAKNHIVKKSKRISDISFSDVNLDYILSSAYTKDHNSPEKIILRDEIDLMIQNIIENLPKELKKVIILREIKGHTYSEIAKIMECPVGTVRSRIFRARETIDKLVQPYYKHSS